MQEMKGRISYKIRERIIKRIRGVKMLGKLVSRKKTSLSMKWNQNKTFLVQALNLVTKVIKVKILKEMLKVREGR